MLEVKPLQLTARQVRMMSIFALLITLIAGGVLFGGDRGHEGSGFKILATLGWLLPGMITVGRPGWRPPQPGELDEREQADRLRALVISHRVTGVMLGMGFIYLLPGVRLGWWLPTALQASWLLGAMVWLHLMLPATLLAWRALDDGECD